MGASPPLNQISYQFVMKTTIYFALLSFVFIALLCGCRSRPSHPKITLETIQRDIVEKHTDEGVNSWTFGRDESREISIIESKCEGDKTTIIIDMKTQGAAGWRAKMAGKLRLHYEWIADEWNLTRVENLTFKKFGDKKPRVVEPVITYHCDKCGHEFDYKAPEQDTNNPTAGMPDPMMGPRPIECPKCHAKPFTAWLMNRCVAPKCGKLFPQLPESHDPRWSGEVVCPWCKTNQTQFIRDIILNR